MTATQRVIANICGCHGIKGELKLYPLTDSFEQFKDIEEVNIAEQNYKVSKFRPNKQLIILKLEEVNTRNQAEELKGFVRAEISEELEEGEYYLQDLIGLEVKDASGESIGKVNNFTESGQTLIFINLDEKYAKKNDLLVPFVEKYIDEININEAFIKLKDISELIDLNK